MNVPKSEKTGVLAGLFSGATIRLERERSCFCKGLAVISETTINPQTGLSVTRETTDNAHHYYYIRDVVYGKTVSDLLPKRHILNTEINDEG